MTASLTTDRAPVTVGVDIGGTKILAGAVTEDGQVVRTERVATPPRDTDQDVFSDVVADLVRDVASGLDCVAVGVGIAGFVDADRSHVVFAAHLPWRQYAVDEALGKRLDLDVVLENDANAAIWAEHRFGVAAGATQVLGATLGTGLGGAAIIAGRLHRGAGGMAAEFGHVRLVPEGRPCVCGQRGCLEQYASGTALTVDARDLVARGREAAGELYDRVEGNGALVTGPMVSEAARNGDRAALGLFAGIGRRLGEGLAMLVAAFDPEVVVIGGGLAEEFDLFADATRESLRTHLTGGSYRVPPEVVAARLGQDAGFLGAADLARAEA